MDQAKPSIDPQKTSLATEQGEASSAVQLPGASGIEESEKSPAQSRRNKILRLVVIDSHNLFREGMLRLLIMEGDFAPVTGPFSEARSLVQHYWPDLVLFGLGPLKERGIDTAKNMRSEFPKIPLLLLDESVRFRHVREALVMKAEGYWTKHVTHPQIIAAMRSVVAGGDSFCPEVEKHLERTSAGLRFDPPHTIPELGLLTHQEGELFLLFAQGYSSRQCAEQLGINEDAADSHRAEIMGKLRVREIADLTQLAVKEGLFD